MSIQIPNDLRFYTYTGKKDNRSVTVAVGESNSKHLEVELKDNSIKDAYLELLDALTK